MCLEKLDFYDWQCTSWIKNGNRFQILACLANKETRRNNDQQSSQLRQPPTQLNLNLRPVSIKLSISSACLEKSPQLFWDWGTEGHNIFDFDNWMRSTKISFPRKRCEQFMCSTFFVLYCKVVACPSSCSDLFNHKRINSINKVENTETSRMPGMPATTGTIPKLHPSKIPSAGHIVSIGITSAISKAGTIYSKDREQLQGAGGRASFW